MNVRNRVIYPLRDRFLEEKVSADRGSDRTASWQMDGIAEMARLAAAVLRNQDWRHFVGPDSIPWVNRWSTCLSNRIKKPSWILISERMVPHLNGISHSLGYFNFEGSFAPCWKRPQISRGSLCQHQRPEAWAEPEHRNRIIGSTSRFG